MAGGQWTTSTDSGKCVRKQMQTKGEEGANIEGHKLDCARLHCALLPSETLRPGADVKRA